MKADLRSLPITALPLLLIILLAACSGSAPRQSEFMERHTSGDITSRELQVRVFSLTSYFAGVVEDAADEIYRQTDDPTVKDRALLWKMTAIPKMQRAAFRDDSLAGLISAWGFCVQMREFFTSGVGRGHFGEYQDVALTASREAERVTENLARSVMAPDLFSTARAELHRWAAAYPITGFQFNRLADSDSLATLADTRTMGGLAAAGAMNEQMRTMSERLNIHLEQLPKLLRWQGELMAGQVPALMAGERDSILAALDIRLQETLTYLSGERQIMAEEMLLHRLAMREAMREEREASLAALRSERVLVLETLSREREILVDSLATTLPRAMGEVIDDAEPLLLRNIDYVIKRLALLGVVPLLILICMGLAALWLGRRAVG